MLAPCKQQGQTTQLCAAHHHHWLPESHQWGGNFLFEASESEHWPQVHLGILLPGGPHTVWAQGRDSPPRAFPTSLTSQSPLFPAYSRGQQKLGCSHRTLPLSPLRHSACTERQCSWGVPLWFGGAPGPPGCSSAQLHSWHLPRCLRCLQPPWLGQPLDAPKGANTAQGPYPNGGAEPGCGLGLGQLQERKAERLSSGWSPVHQ